MGVWGWRCCAMTRTYLESTSDGIGLCHCLVLHNVAGLLAASPLFEVMTVNVI